MSRVEMESGLLKFVTEPSDSVRLMIAQHRVADAGKLVGKAQTALL